MERLTVRVDDDYPLGITYFPGGDTALLISAAMAVQQEFYHPIARYFQECGYSVVTFDYRGLGASAPPSLRGFTATIGDWALRDQQGVMNWVREKLSPRRFLMLGHSLGGKLAGFTKARNVDGMACICTLSGYWRLQPAWEPYKVLFHTSLTFPLSCFLFGYMPWSRLARGCDLPRAAALQWARWCRHPNYLFSDPSLPHNRFEEFPAPVLACSVSDDAWSTPRAVEALMKHFRKVQYRHLTPEEFGLTKLGHFGFFRPDSR
ncbi:MAG: alpha/beta fold hydrolase [Candidatus Eremiobacteraeota bacterium]|nr:alpha/beta fold hydrolase [Candidatus Eremiobacteraeota bacterium]